MAFLMVKYFQKSSLISKPGFHMLSSPLSSPSPTKKAEAEKKRREIEENERRKIYAETEGKIYSQEERSGEKNYSEEDRSMYNSKGEEGDEPRGRDVGVIVAGTVANDVQKGVPDTIIMLLGILENKIGR